MAPDRKSRAADGSPPPKKRARPSAGEADPPRNLPSVVPFRPQPAARLAATAAQRDLRIELGRCRMTREAARKLGPGSVVELRQGADDPVDIVAGGRLIARGQAIVLEGKFCVRVTELVAAEQVA